jgi:hypothetical protein
MRGPHLLTASENNKVLMAPGRAKLYDTLKKLLLRSHRHRLGQSLWPGSDRGAGLTALLELHKTLEIWL